MRRRTLIALLCSLVVAAPAADARPKLPNVPNMAPRIAALSVSSYTNAHALTFDATGGATERVSIGALATGGATRLAFAGWIHNPTYEAGEEIVSKSAGAGSRSWSIGLNSSRRIVIVLSGDGTATYTAQTTTNDAPLNTWYHLAVFIDLTQATDAARVRLFVNGSQATLSFTNTAPSSLFSNATAAVFGAFARLSAGDNFLSGSLDELAIWIGAIPTIGDVYRTTSYDLATSATAPTHCYDINNNVANTITDRCTGALNATMVNMESTDIAVTPAPLP